MPDDALHPFPYDAFQQRAIDVIDRHVSLFVSAPTGSGKTVIADYVIEQTLRHGRRVIYTAPIKALSNQKFRDFHARHGEQVGIMTGDVTLNPTAPLLIMTTEIYRNTLLEDPGRLGACAWIIFDEVHYLDDVDRGTVWEEALVFTPPHINLLCLSATIPNVEELAQWIRHIHQRPIEVIEETTRPVSLSFFFQCQNAIFHDVHDLKRNGYSGHNDWRQLRWQGGGRHHLPLHPNRLDRLIQDLVARQRLPAILFTFGRRRTEDLAWELSGFQLLEDREQRRLLELFDGLCKQFQVEHDRGAEALRRLVEHGIAFHHAGMLPTMKEVIERCFASRLMKVIVTTETFALGVNMPARSVILDDVKKRADSGFTLLRRREFLQMAGRAGRRGMDEAGFVYLRLNPLHVTHSEILHLLHGAPEPVQSRFNTTYATLLNLYRRHGRGLLDMFTQTLYYVQTSGQRRQAGLDLMRHKLDLLSALGYISAAELTAKGAFASWLYGYELLLTELYMERRLERLSPLALATLALAIVFEPKPRTQPPKPYALSKQLAGLCKAPLARIHQEERRFGISPATKTPAFHLARALEAWMSKAPFERLTKFCDVDEGEIVRYFRMSIQLLRQLSESPVTDAALRGTAQQAWRRMNRDVIDAEAQLRLG